MKSPNPCRCIETRKAFTLIELLTVIAIIGILAAIIIPVAGSVRSHARQATCASNLRQWGVASQLYLNDNKGRLPWPQNTASKPAPTNNWAGAMYPYVKGGGAVASQWADVQRILSPAVLGCPINDPKEAGVGQPFFAYKMNAYLGESVPGSGQLGVHLSDVSNPARTVMLADGRAPGQSADCKFFYYDQDTATTGSNGSQAISYPHSSKSNVLFVDGHVEAKKKEDLAPVWNNITRP